MLAACSTSWFERFFFFFKQILEYIKLKIIVGEMYIRKSELICLNYQKKKSPNDQSHAQFKLSCFGVSEPIYNLGSLKHSE